MTLFLAFVIAMFVSMALIPPLMKAATYLHVVDLPNERKLHSQPIPRVGGAAMIVGAVLPIVAWAVPDPQVVGLLVGMAIVFVFGMWDDWKNLDFRFKFLGQLLAVAVVIGYGGVTVRYLPMLGDHPLPMALAVPITTIALLGITNAINLSDGLDGLAGGLTLMSLGIIAVLAFLSGQATVMLIAIAVVGGIVGFIRFNTHPASIFMGDGGSQFLGFTVGVLSLLLIQQPSGMYSYALPLVILALPILDTTMVFARRVYEGRSPFKADKNHVHHRLLALGCHHHEAVLVLYLLQGALFVSAYLLRYENDGTVLIFWLGFSATVSGFFAWASWSGWRLRHRGEATTIAGEQRWRRFETYLSRVMLMLVAGAAAVYLLGGAWFATNVSIDVAVLAGVALAALALGALRSRGDAPNGIERVALYVAVCIVVYLAQTEVNVHGGRIPLYANLFFVGIAVMLVLALRYSKDKQFRPTTLDFLVLFIAVIVPNLPGLTLLDTAVTESIAKALVLLYGVELILAHRGFFWRVARAVACVALVLIGRHALEAMM